MVATGPVVVVCMLFVSSTMVVRGTPVILVAISVVEFRGAVVVSSVPVEALAIVSGVADELGDMVVVDSTVVASVVVFETVVLVVNEELVDTLVPPPLACRFLR